MNPLTVSFQPNLAAAAIILLLACVLFDAYVERLEADGRDRGYTAILVIAGTLGVLVAFAVSYSVEAALNALVLFAAAGAPMAVGSIHRHQERRRAEERAAAELISQQLKGSPHGRQTDYRRFHLEEEDCGGQSL